MNILLAAEIKWIDQNVCRYSSPLHARAVIENIKKRYRIAELELTIKRMKGA